MASFPALVGALRGANFHAQDALALFTTLD